MEGRRRLLILPFYGWFLFFVVCPFSLMLALSFFARDQYGVAIPAFQLRAYSELFDPVYFRIFSRTLMMATANTLLTLTVAYPMAFFISRLPKRKAASLLMLVMIPFWTNFLIRLLAFMDVLRVEPFGLQLVYTVAGMMLALVYNYLPFAILPLYTTLERIDNSLIEAALDLGASRRQILTGILWPLSKPGIYSAALLVFVPSLGEFLIPDIVGGGKQFYLGTFLHHQFFVSRDWPMGAATIVILILLSILFMNFNPERKSLKALVAK